MDLWSYHLNTFQIHDQSNYKPLLQCFRINKSPVGTYRADGAQFNCATDDFLPELMELELSSTNILDLSPHTWLTGFSDTEAVFGASLVCDNEILVLVFVRSSSMLAPMIDGMIRSGDYKLSYMDRILNSLSNKTGDTCLTNLVKDFNGKFNSFLWNFN